MNMIALIRQTASGAQSKPDLSGVEAALRLKKQAGGAVTAVCLGTEKAIPLLREAVAMGCDSAFLLAVPEASEEGNAMDPAGCACLLAAELRSVHFDAVFAGCYAVDADAIQIGFLLAEKLGLPQVGYADEISSVEGSDGSLSFLVKKQMEDRVQMLKLPSPCLISALPQPNRRIYMTAGGVTRAYAMEIPVCTAKDGAGEGENCGEPRVRLLCSRAKKERRRGTVLTVPTGQAVGAILDAMIKNHIL